jgi:Tfp pilus assembly protein PilX
MLHTGHAGRQHRGAALPVALLLLLVITLLAVAGMRSSAVGFLMAGNEQYRQKAFMAAEAGIEQTMITGTYNPSVPTVTFTGAIPNTASDAYTANVVAQLGGAAQGAIWGSSWNSFSSYHFEVQSTGTSVRNSQATHDQGVAIIAPYSPAFSGPGGL